MCCSQWVHANSEIREWEPTGEKRTPQILNPWPHNLNCHHPPNHAAHFHFIKLYHNILPILQHSFVYKILVTQVFKCLPVLVGHSVFKSYSVWIRFCQNLILLSMGISGHRIMHLDDILSLKMLRTILQDFPCRLKWTVARLKWSWNFNYVSPVYCLCGT